MLRENFSLNSSPHAPRSAVWSFYLLLVINVLLQLDITERLYDQWSYSPSLPDLHDEQLCVSKASIQPFSRSKSSILQAKLCAYLPQSQNLKSIKIEITTTIAFHSKLVASYQLPLITKKHRFSMAQGRSPPFI